MHAYTAPHVAPGRTYLPALITDVRALGSLPTGSLAPLDAMGKLTTTDDDPGVVAAFLASTVGWAGADAVKFKAILMAELGRVFLTPPPAPKKAPKPTFGVLPAPKVKAAPVATPTLEDLMAETKALRALVVQMLGRKAGR